MTNTKNIMTCKQKQNYTVDMLSIVPFIIMLITGCIMLSYHAGTPYESKILNFTGNNWLTIHKIFSVISAVFIAIHLVLHGDWLKKLVTNKLKSRHKKLNTALLIIFILTNLTAIFSWLVFPETEMAKGLTGVHNKLGVLLIIIFAFHLKHYTKWLIVMTKQSFRGDMEN